MKILEFCTFFLGYFSIKLHSFNVSFEPNVLFNITCIALYKYNDSKRWVKLKLFRNLLKMLFYLYFTAFIIRISSLILFLLRPIFFLYLRQLLFWRVFVKVCFSVRKMFNFAMQNSISKNVVLPMETIHKFSTGNY